VGQGRTVSTPSDLRWRKSTLSGNSNCVEVARVNGGVLIRDSRNREGLELFVTDTDWECFLGGVKLGEFG
jgi:hypothetical protein